MTPIGRLDLMLDDMAAADPLFRPTNFWDTGLVAIVDDLRTHGFDNFRAHKSALQMYVPAYASGAYRTNPQRIQRLSRWIRGLARNDRIADLLLADHAGKLQAERDYLVFQAASRHAAEPLLHDLSESEAGQPFEQYTFDGRRYSRSFLNYLRGLAFLKQHADTGALSSILEIGGGFGTAGEILLKARSGAVYVNVDIPPVAAVSTHYLQQALGDETVLGYEATREMETIDIHQLPAGVRAVVLCPWQLPRLVGAFDLFVNFISFQEMEPDVVAHYIQLVQPLTKRFVLLRNSHSGKQVVTKAGELGVFEPSSVDAMIERFDAFSLLARDCRIFGERNERSGFRSEVVALVRR